MIHIYIYAQKLHHFSLDHGGDATALRQGCLQGMRLS